VRGLPAINLLAVFFCNDRLCLGAYDLNVFVFRDSQLDQLIHHDCVRDEVLRTPELVGSLGLFNVEAYLVFERIAGTERFDRNLLLLQVAIERRDA
jgi:hypothetical protein